MLSTIPSIIKKQIVAVTGVLMIGFLLAHLTGNFLIFKGPDALNGYSDFLHSLSGLLWVMRIGLIAAFVLHLFFTVLVVKENRRARKERYKVTANHREKSSLGVKTMPLTGTIILVYLAVHLIDFTFSDHTANADGLYGVVVATLSNPFHAAGYIIAMLAIGLHLSHAVQSVFQTFGFSNSQSQGKLESISLAIGLLISLGYSSIPIYIMAVLS